MKLFERHARGVEPTWYGHVLIRRARAAMSEIGRAQEEIAALRAGRMGQASIGTVVNPGTNLVPQAIAEVKREFPTSWCGWKWTTAARWWPSCWTASWTS